MLEVGVIDKFERFQVKQSFPKISNSAVAAVLCLPGKLVARISTVACQPSKLRIVIEGCCVQLSKVVVIKFVLNAKIVDVDSIVLPT